MNFLIYHRWCTIFFESKWDLFSFDILTSSLITEQNDLLAIAFLSSPSKLITSTMTFRKIKAEYSKMNIGYQINDPIFFKQIINIFEKIFKI